MKSLGIKPGSHEIEAMPEGGGDREHFPTAYLEGDAVDALDLSGKRVGDEMMLITKIRVSSVSEYKEGERNVSFELLEGETKPVESKPDPASILFPEG